MKKHLFLKKKNDIWLKWLLKIIIITKQMFIIIILILHLNIICRIRKYYNNDIIYSYLIFFLLFIITKIPPHDQHIYSVDELGAKLSFLDHPFCFCKSSNIDKSQVYFAIEFRCKWFIIGGKLFNSFLIIARWVVIW